MIELVETISGLWGFELRGWPEEKLKKLRAIISNNWMDSEAYKRKQSIQPFIQGWDVDVAWSKYPHSRRTWMLVEFWTDNEQDCREYIEYLNKRMKEE